MSVPSLGEWFEAVFVRSFQAGNRPRTLKEYRLTNRKWKRNTGDPPMDQIDSLMLGEFKAWLFDDEKLARPTVNKHLRHVHCILGKAGPPGPGNRDAVGIVPTAPWTKPLKEFRRLPRRTTPEVLEVIYKAARFANYPALDHMAAADWWRALIVLAYTSGYRHGALMGLRWSEVDLARKEIRVEAESDKCGRERIKPLHAVAIRHLVRIRIGQGPVFPWHYSEATWYRQWHRIQTKAGLDREEHVKLHDLKRTAGSIAAEHGSAFAVQRLLDHSSIRTAEWYVNPMDELRGVVDAFPIPAAFEET